MAGPQSATSKGPSLLRSRTSMPQLHSQRMQAVCRQSPVASVTVMAGDRSPSAFTCATDFAAGYRGRVTSPDAPDAPDAPATAFDRATAVALRPGAHDADGRSVHDMHV